MQAQIVIPILISLLSLAVSTIALYQTTFRRASLSLILASRIKLSHPRHLSFSLLIPMTVSNDSAQPGLVHKIAIAVRMENVEKDYHYLDWESFVVYRPERNSWDMEELAHPFLVPGKSSWSKIIAYRWSRTKDHYLTDVGTYRLRILCWTSRTGNPTMTVEHFFVVNRDHKASIDARLDGAVPDTLAHLPRRPVEQGYNTDLVLDQQMPENDVLTETEAGKLIARPR